MGDEGEEEDVLTNREIWKYLRALYEIKNAFLRKKLHAHNKNVKNMVKVTPRREVSFKNHGSGHQQPNRKNKHRGKYQFSAIFFLGKKLIFHPAKFNFHFGF